MFVTELVPTTNSMVIQKIESVNSPFQKQREETRVSIQEKTETKTPYRKKAKRKKIKEFVVARSKERKARVFNP